jgi:catechol 2,3-dioxygenase-like lactoylglutathione lyase family enzyme
MATERGFSPRGIGEVVVRVRDLQRMIDFYQATFGLELLKRFGDDIAFLRIADGFGGHTQIVGFFRDTMPSNFKRRAWEGHETKSTTLHHFALEIPAAEYDSAIAHFRRLGLEIDTAIHGWAGWRSIYLRDPEENTVELVCFYQSLLDDANT